MKKRIEPQIGLPIAPRAEAPTGLPTGLPTATRVEARPDPHPAAPEPAPEPPPPPPPPRMRAAVVDAFDRPPRYAEIELPVAQPGEVVVDVSAAALSQLVRAQAAGKHYSAGKTLPLVPGADGVGRLADGTRVYFAFPRAPIGAMAGQVAVARDQVVALPDEVDDLTAAAIANPGMSSWAALVVRAGFVRGESVLVNGAAGLAGRLAIQVARHLGARRVIASARRAAVEGELRALGADDVVLLDQAPESLVQRLREVLPQVDVVLDYLWGAPAAAIFEAAAGIGGSGAPPRLRFVNIGSLAGPTLPLAAGTLRSSGLELTGSGLGSVSPAQLVQIVGELLRAVRPAGLRVNANPVPVAEVERTWVASAGAAERVVFTF